MKEAPFKVGDLVCDSSENVGVITEISWCPFCGQYELEFTGEIGVRTAVLMKSLVGYLLVMDEMET